MPRIARKNYTSSFFHIMTQGIEKQAIFDNPINMRKYIELIKKNTPRANVKIIAYCIMPNHTHLLIYSKSIKNLTAFFRYTNTSYAQYFNSKNNRVGYVFRDRFKVKEINTKSQLIATIKYIHNNPVKAHLCENIEDYPFSSYIEYFNKTIIVDKKILQKCISQKILKTKILNNDNMYLFKK